MELAYTNQTNSKRKLSLLGLASVGVSALLVCVPLAAIVVCNYVASSVNGGTMLRKIAYGGVELAQIFNASVITLSLIALLMAGGGLLVSRKQCLASVGAVIFNLGIILCVVTRMM